MFGSRLSLFAFGLLCGHVVHKALWNNLAGARNEDDYMTHYLAKPANETVCDSVFPDRHKEAVSEVDIECNIRGYCSDDETCN